MSPRYWRDHLKELPDRWTAWKLACGRLHEGSRRPYLPDPAGRVVARRGLPRPGGLAAVARLHLSRAGPAELRAVVGAARLHARDDEHAYDQRHRYAGPGAAPVPGAAPHGPPPAPPPALA